jgi:uncharacterized protein
MKDLIHNIITSIVDHPDKVIIEESTNSDDNYKTYLLKVAPEDMGRVIGKNGKIIRAIRNLIHVRALLKSEKATLTLKED